MDGDAPTRRRIAAVFDRIIPADEYPAVSDAGLFEHLDRLAADPLTAGVVDQALAIVDAVEVAAADRHGRALTELDDAELDAVIGALDWRDREHLVQLAAQAYYGGPETAGADMIGFDAAPKRGPAAPIVEPRLATTLFADLAGSYDVVVVGAGAGGGVAACVLAEAGARVLLVDRGEVLRFGDVGRDHMRNHRAAVYGHNTGPAVVGNPRVLVDGTGRRRLVQRSHDPRWHNNAMAVGGGTRVYQGMAWRFVPTDFRMASTYGLPDGSSLADWPIGYDDLEPHYDWAEHAIGVCGDGGAHRAQGPRRRGYPMAPLPPNTEAFVLAAGAERLGLDVGPVPLLINSEPRDGRARCVRCGECVGFACPSDAKNGSHDTVIPRALATGNATLVDRCRAVRIDTDTTGRVTGVELVDERTGATASVASADVVVSCGAIETARLLLASRSDRHPDGIGNRHDQVGRHLQGHSFVSAFGLFDDPVVDMDGPGVSIATCDHNHENAGVVGGGVISNELIKIPIVHWLWSHRPDAPRWGADAKAAMRDSYLRTGHLFCQIQEIPQPGNRVTLAGDVRDDRGMPVAVLAGSAHHETVRAAEHVQAVAASWLEASGARRVWTDAVPRGLTAGQHQAGTCRMGDDPATSVTDPLGRVHGHDNLWVADASLHPTNGGFNPVLTIFAMAHRTAGHLAGQRGATRSA
jgi:choline dehydrogenase-like flavoprotein